MKRIPIRPNGTNHLTKRQKQIMVLIAEDLSSREIGTRLGISPKTVEYHKDLIRQRLEVKGTAGIVRYAIRAGLVKL